MPCMRKIATPEEIAREILAALEAAANDRNDLIVRSDDAKGKIGVTIQIDDPKKSGVIQIDVDAPAPEHGETKDVILAHLEINKETGAMLFCPRGCAPPGETHELDAHDEILERMVEIIWEN